MVSATLPGPLLALDATGDPSSVALLAADGAVVERVAAPGERAGRALHGLIALVLQAAGDDRGLAAMGLEAIVVVRGPGSFTGLRVGLAAAAGLARSLGLVVRGVETTRCLALACQRRGRVGVLVDAGQGRLFVAEHETGVGAAPRVVAPVADCSPAEALARIAADPSVAWLLRGTPPSRDALVEVGAIPFEAPLAGAAARLARWPDAVDPAVPLYLREPAIRPPTARVPGPRRSPA